MRRTFKFLSINCGFHDLTFIITTNGIGAEKHHCMSIGGKFDEISIDDLLRLGRDNSVRNSEEVIDNVLKGTANFETLAAANSVDSFHIELISRRLQELRGLSPKSSSFNFVSEDGSEVSDIRFERTTKGNIHLIANVNGREEKFVITPKKEVYQTILDAGFNKMPDEQKKALVEQYILVKVRGQNGY